MPPRARPPTDPLDRIAALLDPARVDVEPRITAGGYLDVLAQLPTATTVGARTMRTAFYPLIYQRIRPVALRIASGLRAPGRDGDRLQVVQRLALHDGATILDVACGPGNFTGHFGAVVGPTGLAVGLDASDTMLSKAVEDNSGASVGYLRGDAERLPFPDASFDAVSCFAALYLINDPYATLAEMARVLRPGGRIAILTSYAGQRPAMRLLARVNQAASGIRAFGRDDITGALRRHGLVDVRQQVSGVAQEVWARRPD